MTIKNATPHALQLKTTGGQIVTLPPLPTVVRVTQAIEAVGEVDLDPQIHGGARLALSRTTLGRVEGIERRADGGDLIIPAPLLGRHLDLHAGDVLIVSLVAATAIREQAASLDLPAGVRVCAPGPPLRDAEGRVVGADGLSLFYESGGAGAPPSRAIVLPASVAADVAAYGGDTPPPNRGTEGLQDWLWGTFGDLAAAPSAPAARLTPADLPPAMAQLYREGSPAVCDGEGAAMYLDSLARELRALVGETVD